MLKSFFECDRKKSIIYKKRIKQWQEENLLQETGK